MELKDLIDIRADELRILNENEGVDVTKEALTLIKEAITNLAFAYKYMSVEGDVYGSGTPVAKLIEAEKKSRDAKRKVNTLSKNSELFRFTPEMKKVLSMAVNSISDALKNVDEKVIKLVIAEDPIVDDFSDEIETNEPAPGKFNPLKDTGSKSVRRDRVSKTRSKLDASIADSEDF
jgi:cell fate (sporulation/competence/biofilm development) regulator YmcA (YheA/YmcA/DUF963 family)